MKRIALILICVLNLTVKAQDTIRYTIPDFSWRTDAVVTIAEDSMYAFAFSGRLQNATRNAPIFIYLFDRRFQLIKQANLDFGVETQLIDMYYNVSERTWVVLTNIDFIHTILLLNHELEVTDSFFAPIRGNALRELAGGNIGVFGLLERVHPGQLGTIGLACMDMRGGVLWIKEIASGNNPVFFGRRAISILPDSMMTIRMILPHYVISDEPPVEPRYEIVPQILYVDQNGMVVNKLYLETEKKSGGFYLLNDSLMVFLTGKWVDLTMQERVEMAEHGEKIVSFGKVVLMNIKENKVIWETPFAEETNRMGKVYFDSMSNNLVIYRHEVMIQVQNMGNGEFIWKGKLPKPKEVDFVHLSILPYGKNQCAVITLARNNLRKKVGFMFFVIDIPD